MGGRGGALGRSVFTTADLGRVAVDFASPMGKILPLVRGESGVDCNAAATVEVGSEQRTA